MPNMWHLRLHKLTVDKSSTVILYMHMSAIKTVKDIVSRADVPRLHIVISDHCGHILYIYVPEHCRNQCVGTRLIGESAKMCRKIVLDDMSDRYRQTNNLYVRLGFVYMTEHGPEMSASSRIISKNIHKLNSALTLKKLSHGGF